MLSKLTKKAESQQAPVSTANSEKIDEAKSNVDWKLVKKEITLLRLEGRFR